MARRTTQTARDPRPDSPARQQLLDAAGDLFYQRGVHAVGVNDVVAHSGISKMTLYSHFRSKDLLVAAWLRRESERWRAWFTSTLERAAPDARERLGAVFDVLEEWFTTPGFRGCPFLNTAAEFPDSAHPARRVIEEHRAAVRDHLTGVARDAGAKDAPALGAALLTIMDGAVIGAMSEPPSVAASRAAAISRLLVSQSL